MHVRLMFPAQYLAGEDLQAAGKDVTLTISRLVRENVRTEKGDEAKWVLFFSEMEERNRRDPNQPNKRMVVNKTNARQIAKLYGPETNDWIGKRITLYHEPGVMAFGKRTGGIRIRDAVPPEPKTQPRPDPEPAQDAGDEASAAGAI